MSPQARYSQSQKGSMAPFWIVIGIAVVCLVVYGVLSAGRLKGPSSKSAIIPEDKRDAVPTRALEALPPATGSLKVSSLQGKVVVLHFWASWCGPCRAEFPEFAKFADEASDRSGVAVVPISTDIASEKAVAFLSQMNIRFSSYLDSGGLSEELGVGVIPTTILVDKKGRIAWRATGASDWSEGGVPLVINQLESE